MLGIIGAMDEEVAKLKEKMEQVHIIEKAGMQFYRGTLCDREVVVVKCGVGKVHAAMCTQAMIDLFPVDGIVNTGIAGSLNADINIGDIVLAKDALEHDMDVSALGYAPGINPDLKDDENIFKTDEKNVGACSYCSKAGRTFHQGLYRTCSQRRSVHIK